MNKKGRFIVIDGTDGSGKATQTKLLIKRLKEKGKSVRVIDFPRYEKNFFGKMVGRYLSGEFGSASEVSPYLASILYAADRFESAKKIQGWIDKGYVVIADRYASSNQIHQGGKIKNAKKRKEFLGWLEEMEFGVFKISRPDAIIYLDMPLKISQKLLSDKKLQGSKKYLKGKKDIHENDPRHLEDAKMSAIKMISENNNWVKVQCVKKGQLMSIEDIGELVWQNVKKLLNENKGPKNRS